MRHFAKLVGLAMIAAVFAVPTAANAATTNATGLVDGTIVVGGTTCTWTNGVTSNVPPNALTIDRSTVNRPGGNLTCSGDASNVTVTNNANVTFNDTAGTATVDKVAVTAIVFGISCSYEATNVVATRSGTTRSYSASGFLARKTSGGFLCPGDTTDTSATVSFH